MKKLTFFILTFLFVVNLYAQDWPQFLGPERNSTSPQKNILRTWPEEGPELLWSVPVGIGYGGPVIKDDKVYLLDHEDTSDKMRCFDLKSGQEVWNFSYEASGFMPFPGSRSVPVADDNFVYSCGQNGDLFCYDINTHKPVWNKNIWTDFGGERIPMFGISQCPLIYGDLLILASQAPDAGVVAFDKITGNLRWKTPPLGTAVGNVSPAIVKIDGEDQLIMISASPRGGSGKIVGYDPLNGKTLWEFTNWQCEFPVPSAIDAGNNKVLVIGGYELGAVMLQIDKTQDGTYGASELFRTEEFGAHTKPAILHKGYFYAQYGTNNRRDGMVCMSMDGQIMWKTKREPSFDKGSMILADGMLLCTDGATRLYLIDPDPSAIKVLASAELLEKGNGNSSGIGGATQNWAPIALSDGKLLIRDQKQLKCVKVGE